ncbi:amino-acid N-acetyltransferase [Chthoniobacter flavus Ellin428]|uniref:amino-acid N-acetyltransferase n=1 Tax=Chthoniobacter flavus Ellin428 TaxID=497964 RepID=B4D049_9BACT|nr:amino-acid N-acetyltransferase [Chthoniobacter flavus]EDY20363.1 amino-acid N-acetyltransferase [Chthoniobacter flavus Ellin428]TCO94256.1 N-acetylglutamate synthase [Chthoniobacter flavus]
MKVSDLRGILQYVPRFRERIFVVAIDGEIVASPNFANILLDLAVLRSLSIKVILVHGAAMQITQLAAERGVAISNADGTGITDEPTLKVGLEAVTNVMGEVMQGLTSVDLRAVYSNAIIAHPAGILSGVDQLNTGRVERVDTKSLHLFLNEGIIPVIPPIGYDGEGKTFRVNSDSVALEVAEAMGAIKILYLSAYDGVVVDGELVGTLSIAEAEDFVKKHRGTGLVETGLISKVEHAVKACRLVRVPRVHLLNGLKDEALLSEVFSQEGIGTMVYSNEYQQIRRVYKKDVRAVMALIRQSVDSEELVKRTRADILAHLDDYHVLEVDRNLVGCVALHVYAEQGIAELACLYVHKNHEGQGYGRKLMNYAEQLAAEKGVKQVMALSTQTFNYFQQKGGYTESTPDILPPERRKKYDASARNSKVMIKNVSVVAPLEASRV